MSDLPTTVLIDNWFVDRRSIGRAGSRWRRCGPLTDLEAVSTYAIQAGAAEVRGTVMATGSWSEFTPQAVGELELPAGRVRTAVRPISAGKGAVGNLKSLAFRKVGPR